MMYMKITTTLSFIGLSLFMFIGCIQETSDTEPITEIPEKELSVANEAPSPFDGIPKEIDQLPLFAGTSSKVESDYALVQYLSNNLKYPKEAREAKIEGRVYIQFIVEKDGSISNVHLAKGIGGGCDEAAMAVVEGINDLDVKWSTPIHEGKASKVMYTLPIAFKLES